MPTRTPMAMDEVIRMLARQLSTPVASHAPTTEVTQLSPEEEAAFQAWARASGIRDLDMPESRYDYRGYWKENGPVPYRWGVDHLTDPWKQHGHEVFSNESNYARGPADGGRWLGEALIPPPMPSHGIQVVLDRLLRGR